jgi:uncharacterized protein (DUF302 family)
MTKIGLLTVTSEFGFPETIARLETAIAAAGMSVFARIDHGAAAGAVQLVLRPTVLMIFGNAKGGTLLMQAQQAVGIDLPLKALVYQEASGQVLLAYNEPGWIAERHGLGAEVAPVIAGMAGALKRIVLQAAQSHAED